MIKEKLLFKDTPILPPLIQNYLKQKEPLQIFYNQFPTRENFIIQAEKKAKSYAHRKSLYKALTEQYKGREIHLAVMDNLKALQNENTFTITTGHQLNLFTGPVYFIYKILFIINLSEEMNRYSSSRKFVPVYWMATEDHDFDEINHFRYNHTTIRWETSQKGAVGRFHLEGIQKVIDAVKYLLPDSKKKNYLLNLFEKSYLNAVNLAEATRRLVDELFSEYGLIIIDGDDRELKSLFKPYIREELQRQTAYKYVSETKDKLAEKGYKIQVNPREINLFYLLEAGRERIILENGRYKINNTSKIFSEEEILKELKESPQNFSPNVILRPLYQEVILPNVAYIGGAAEIAYWLELKSFFASQKVEFPIIKLRNSIFVLDKSSRKNITKKGLSLSDIFLDPEVLYEQIVRKNTEINLSFEEYFTIFEREFSKLRKLAAQTDKSFINAVNAHQAKAQRSIRTLEKRLLKAEKKKFIEMKDSLYHLYQKIHPEGKIQERTINIIEMIIKTRQNFVKCMKDNINPFEDEVVIFTF